MYEIIREEKEYKVLALSEENEQKYIGIKAPIVVVNKTDKDITLVISEDLSEDDRSTVPEEIYIHKNDFTNLDCMDGITCNIKIAFMNGDYKQKKYLTKNSEFRA